MTTETEMNVTYQNGWAVPAGWKLVPEEPTYELECEVGGVRMDEEFFLNEYADREKLGEICRAVVKYSPQPPKAPDYNPGPLEVSVVGMPEFDALIDHIYEEGTTSEGVIHLTNKLVRAAIQSHISYARNAQQQQQQQWQLSVGAPRTPEQIAATVAWVQSLADSDIAPQPPSAPVGVEGLLADLETIWHSVSDDKETNAAYQRLKSALAQQQGGE